MKVSNLVALALASEATARFHEKKDSILAKLAARDIANTASGLAKRQSIASAFVTMVNAGYGKTWGMMSGKTPMAASHTNIPGMKTVKMRYGPYTVPSNKVTTRTMTGSEEGMLWNYPDTNIAKPCNDCMVTGITADYEDLQGNSVNIDSGQWLHHIVLLNSGSGRSDPTCKFAFTSLPHWVVGYSPSSSERLWASGNERSPIDFAGWNITNAGYKINYSDSFSMIVDLMNMTPQTQTRYVVIKFDYVDGKPSGMKEIQPVWLDIDQCGFSEAFAKSQTGAYTISSTSWRTPLSGELLGVGGHLHDGGVTARIKVDGKVACDSRATYGGNPKYVSGGGEGHHGGMGKKHISSMILCVKGSSDLKVQRMEAGQYWTIEAEYDYQKYAGATHSSGLQENVMGIALVYITK